MKLVVFLFLPFIMIILGFLRQVKTPQNRTVLVQLIQRRLEKKQISIESFFEILGRRFIWEGLGLALIGVSLFLNSAHLTFKELMFMILFKLGVDIVAILLTIFVSIFE